MTQVVDRKDRILQLIRIKGPVIPSQINKEINLDILLTSAALGELVDKKELKVSSIKIGGTPLYYLPGQETRLQQFSNKLNEKDRRAFDLVRQKKILRDKDMTPLMRVSLRSIRDFAKPLTVNVRRNVEIFWKWYGITNEEAVKLIRDIIKPEAEKPAAFQTMAENPPSTEEKRKIPVKEEPRADAKKLTKPKEKVIVDKFLENLMDYFNKNRIEIIEKKVLRKNSDVEFMIRVPSSVGMLSYYCKAKNKKRINDGDLSSAYLQGQAKKMPILFLTTGQLTKKAKEMLNVEFRGMSIKKI